MTDLTSEWVEFLCYPLPLPDGVEDTGEYEQFGRAQLKSLLAMAVRNSLLPPSTQLVQFIHVTPMRQAIDFGITTALRTDIASALLANVAFHGAFVKRNELSFFQEAAARYTDRGLICVISIAEVPEATIPNTEVLIADGVPTPNSSPPPYVYPVTFEHLPSTRWAMIPETAIESIISHAEQFQITEAVDTSQYQTHALALSPVLGEASQSYLCHIAPFAAIGAVILCTPRLFASHDSSRHAASAGGCMFVTDAPPTPEDLCAFYTAAHKLCLVAAGIEHAIERREVFDRDLFFNYASHTVVGPVADSVLFLKRAIADAESPNVTKIRRAINTLSTLRRNAQTLLSVCRAEFLPSEAASREGAFNLGERINSYLADIQDYRDVVELPAIPIRTDFNDVEEIRCPMPDLLDVVLTTLIRNALDHIDAGLHSEVPITQCGLEVWVRREHEMWCIAIANGGRPVAPSEIDRLNAERPDDTAWRVSRKGEHHYRLGNRKVKWILNRLAGTIEYTLVKGRFVASVHLPVGNSQ